jgi:hypothetical protein
MPAKGSKLKINNRESTISKEIYSQYVEKYGDLVDYKTFKKIIQTCNLEITNCVLDDISGFKLPFNLGYIVVTKFKGRYTKPDYKNSKIYNKTIPLLNLHSFGFIFNIKWFKTNAKGIYSNSKLYPYKFNFHREFKRALAKKIKSGKVYDSWVASDFYSKNRL